MSGETLGGWLFLVFWMVPNIAAAVWAWRTTEPPKNRGWEATKLGFGAAGSIALLGILHTFFWLFVVSWPLMWALNKADRYFGDPSNCQPAWEYRNGQR